MARDKALAGNESEDTIISENQMRDREYAITHDKNDDDFANDEPSKTAKATSKEKNLAEVADKARNAPRNG